MIHQKKFVARALAMFALVAPFPVRAQLKLPDGRDVLKRYATATGVAKLNNVAGIHMKGTYDVAAAGLSGTFESLTDKSGRTMQIINITGIGAILGGSDSTYAWSLDPIQGPRILQGPEFIERREEEDVRGMARDPFYVLEARALIRMSVNGEDCVQVKLKWKSGRESIECFSEKTGLLLQAETTQLTSMGQVQVSRIYSDYKTFDGLTAPTTVVERTQGQEVVQHVTDVTFEAIDPSRFVVPAQIKALRKS